MITGHYGHYLLLITLVKIHILLYYIYIYLLYYFIFHILFYIFIYLYQYIKLKVDCLHPHLKHVPNLITSYNKVDHLKLRWDNKDNDFYV